MADRSTVFESLRPVPEEVLDASELALRLDQASEPFVVRGLATDWPLVQAGTLGPDQAREYLKARARDRKFTVNVGMPGARLPLARVRRLFSLTCCTLARWLLLPGSETLRLFPPNHSLPNVISTAVVSHHFK